MQTIQISNGDTLQFPDEMSDDQIQSAIHKEYGPPSSTSDKLQQPQSSNDQYQQLKQASGLNRTPIDTVRDLSYGALVGLGKGGQSIAKLLNKNSPQMDMEEYFSNIKSPNKSMSGYPESIERSLGQYLPYGIAGGSNALGQILAGSSYGGLTADENQKNMLGLPSGKKGAAMEGLLLSVLGMGALKGAPKAINSISPGKTANEIKSSLANIPTSSGISLKQPELPNLRENSQSLAQDIKNAYDSHTDVVRQKMDPITKKYGESLEIYPLKNPSGINAYREIPNFKLKGTGVNDLYKEFKKNPNLNNSHQLQQKIGFEKGKLESGPKDSAIRKQISNLDSSYKELNSKIDSRLEEIDPQAASQWKEGREYHRVNVIPYRSNNKIKSIVEGKVTSPKNVHQPFEYPGEKLDKKTGKYVVDNANKIISDLPTDSKNKILFSRIGGSSSNETPNKLLSNLNKAKDKGYDTYFNKDLEKNMNDLKNQIRNKEIVNPLSWISKLFVPFRKY